MANIGTFTKTENGFSGTIRTLALSVKANIVPDEHKASEAAPDYRVFSGTVELGAGWKRQGAARSPFGFPIAIKAAMGAAERHEET